MYDKRLFINANRGIQMIYLMNITSTTVPTEKYRKSVLCSCFLRLRR